jgi:DNA-directed RNA polymerase specialized sigma24 family protein
MWHFLIPTPMFDESAERIIKRMTQADLETLPSQELFGLCASHFDDDQYWDEFVRRFNKSLTHSVFQAYRQFNGELQPPFGTISELLQEIYLKILKDRCSILRRFRGDTEIEAEVYLMHIATTVTIDLLRWQRSLKRYVRTESLEDSRVLKETLIRQGNLPSPYTDELAEHDLIKILRRTFTGKNSARDILIFLLHYREGFTPQEIAMTNVCNLKPSSIASILDRMRDRIREVFLIKEQS